MPTATPTPVVVEEESAQVGGRQAGGTGAAGSSAPAGSDAVALAADTWEGGEFQQDFAGRPATVLDGQGDDEASVSFTLAEVPSTGIVVRLTGFQSAPEPGAWVEIVVNDELVWADPSPFGGQAGVNWVPVELPLPPEDFRPGDNELTVRYQSPDGDALLGLDGLGLAVPGATADEEPVPVDESSSGDATDTGVAGSADEGGAPGAAPTIAPRSRR